MSGRASDHPLQGNENQKDAEEAGTSGTITGATWRQMTPYDLIKIGALADRVHTLYERRDILAERFKLFGEGCLTLDHGGEIFGYGIAIPWTLFVPIELDKLVKALPQNTSCLYIHDVAMVPEARRLGYLRDLIEVYDAITGRHGLQTMAIIAVYGTENIWRRIGFEEMDIGGAGLASYGASAAYMVRSVPSL